MPEITAQPTGFDAIQAEYDAARAAAQAAEARLSAAGRALMAAQCGVHFRTSEQRGGRVIRHHCTRAAGHAAAHGNSTFPAQEPGR